MNKIDQNEPFAVVRMHGDHTYGHIDIHIHNMIGEWGCRPTIKITCQAGSTLPDDDNRTYAYSWGVSHDYATLSLHDVESAFKVMKGMQRKLDRMQVELGYGSGSFAEFASRVLIASGIDLIVFNDAWGGGYMHKSLDDLPRLHLKFKKTHGELRNKLADFEASIVGRYARHKA